MPAAGVAELHLEQLQYVYYHSELKQKLQIEFDSDIDILWQLRGFLKKYTIESREWYADNADCIG